MNIQQLEYVVAVADHGSFGKAATAQFISQSTLSTMIARLEDEKKIKIFDRKYKPASITKEGEVFITQCRVILDEIKNLGEVVNNLTGASSGTIKIGVIPTVAPYLLPLFINKLTADKPKVQFIISEMTTQGIIDYIDQRKLDIGILSTPIDHPDLIEHHLYNEPFYLYDKNHKNSLSMVDYKSLDCERLWLMDEGHCLRHQVESVCDLQSKSSFKRNLEYKSGSIDTLLRFVKKNSGLTLLPYLSTLGLSKSDQNHLATFKSPAPARSIGVVVHRNYSKKGLLDLLIRHIVTVTQPLLDLSDQEQWLVDPI